MGSLGDLYHQLYRDRHPYFVIVEDRGKHHLCQILLDNSLRKLAGTPDFPTREEAHEYLENTYMNKNKK